MKQSISILAALLTSIVLTTACSKTDDPPYPRVAPPDRSTTVPLPKTMPENRPVAPIPPVPKTADGKI
jgi:hypothetical protein